jgi:hypothetical protein
MMCFEDGIVDGEEGGPYRKVGSEREANANYKKMVAKYSRTVTSMDFPRNCHSFHTHPLHKQNNNDNISSRHQSRPNQPLSQTSGFTLLDLHNQQQPIFTQNNMSIHTAALEGQFDLVKQLLEQDKAALTSKDEDERQPLHWAGRRKQARKDNIFGEHRNGIHVPDTHA